MIITEYMKYPVKEFSQTRYTYVFTSSDDFPRILLSHKEKYGQKPFPATLERFGIILEEGERTGFPSLPWYPDLFLAAMDWELKTWMNSRSKFEIFVMFDASWTDVSQLEEEKAKLQAWWPTLRENGMLGRCEVLDSRTNLYKNLKCAM